MNPRHRTASLLVALVLTTACGNDTATTATSTTSPTTTTSTTTSTTLPPTTTTEAPAAVEVTRDLPYMETTDGTVRLLDVYHPRDAQNLPLVVVFHPNPVFGRTKASIEDLAMVIAEEGAVVVAPTWGQAMSISDMTAVADAFTGWFRGEGPCAVWAAVELGPAYGAAPDDLVLVGETTGTFAAQAALLDPPQGVDGCESPPASPTIERAVLFETGGFLLPDLWDAVLAVDPAALNRLRPWAELGAPGPTRILVLAGEIDPPEYSRSLEGVGYGESDWVRQRDPDLAFAGFFDAHGGLDDGVMTSIDVSQVIVDVLREAGWDAEFGLVPGVSHALSTDESRAHVADLALGG